MKNKIVDRSWKPHFGQRSECHTTDREQVSAVADEPARHAASRQTCCKQRWTLSVINLQPNLVDSVCDGRCFWIVASYLSKVADFNLPHLHLALPLGWSCLSFVEIFGGKKTRVLVLSYSVVCVILRLAVSVEHRRMTHWQTHDYFIYRASMASRGKNWAFICVDWWLAPHATQRTRLRQSKQWHFSGCAQTAFTQNLFLASHSDYYSAVFMSMDWVRFNAALYTLMWHYRSYRGRNLCPMQC